MALGKFPSCERGMIVPPLPGHSNSQLETNHSPSPFTVGDGKYMLLHDPTLVMGQKGC